MPRPKGSKNRKGGPLRRQMQLSMTAAALRRLDYLCRRRAAIAGGNPAKLRSPIVRALILRAYRRARLADRPGPPAADPATQPSRSSTRPLES